jgi:hypothetical protein
MACELLSLLTGLLVGWFVVWFQIGGRADREDYLVASSAYGAGAVVVLLGLPALARLGIRGWVFTVGAVGGALCALLALRSAAKGLGMEDVGPTISPWYDGAGGVLACPWTWPVIVLGVLALVGRGPERATER